MPSDSAFAHHSSGNIGFAGRIIVVVLLILAISQALGTFLSVLSFETMFLKAITAKYEILGKDLKRQIEQSLKFGKSLDRFVGMDKLVAAPFRQSEDIDEIFLADADGKVLFASGKAEFVMAKSFGQLGRSESKVVYGDYKGRDHFPVRKLFDWSAKPPVTRHYEGRYHVLFPIIPKFGGAKGVLCLVFSQSVLDHKKAELIRHSRNVLVVAIVLSAILIGFLIQFFFIKPARRQVIGVTTRLLKPDLPGTREAAIVVPDEVLAVQACMLDFVASTRQSKQALGEELDHLANFSLDNSKTEHEIRIMKRILGRKCNEEE